MRQNLKTKSNFVRLIIIPVLVFSGIIWLLFFVFLGLFSIKTKEVLQKYKYLVENSLKLNIEKDFQSLNNLLNSYAVWTDFYNALKNNNYTFFNEIWSVDHELENCDSYGIIKENGKVFW